MTDTQEKIKALTQPWQRDAIKWRVGTLTKKKDKTKPLAYVDARVVMARLDSAVGVENWQDRYECHGSRTICYLSIRLDKEWLCKADGAGDTNIEGEKGGLSDAFKRASVKWGMGRELYDMKTRWMPIDEWKQLDGDPWDFVINGNKPIQNKKVIEKKKVVDTPKEIEPEPLPPEELKATWLLTKIKSITTAELLEKFNVNVNNTEARWWLSNNHKEWGDEVENAYIDKKNSFTQSPSGL